MKLVQNPSVFKYLKKIVYSYYQRNAIHNSIKIILDMIFNKFYHQEFLIPSCSSE